MRNGLIIIGLLFIACSTPKQFNKQITVTDTLKNSCSESYKKIKKHWRKHSDENCYYVSSKFYNKGLESVFDECFKNLNISDVKKVIGNPTSISNARDSVYYRFDIYRYSLSPSGKCKYPEWELQFSVDPSTNTIQKISKSIKTIVN